MNNPVSIDSFRDFIKISRTGAITKLTSEQEKQLLDIIRKTNDLTPPDDYPRYRVMSPIPLFSKYLELIFSNDDLWNNFQGYVREFGPYRGDGFFEYHRDPECIEIWRQMIDNMGGGFPLMLFASAAFLLLEYKEQGHDLDAELEKLHHSK